MLVAYNEDLLRIIQENKKISIEDLANLYVDDSLEFDLRKLEEARKIRIKENFIECL